MTMNVYISNQLLCFLFSLWNSSVEYGAMALQGTMIRANEAHAAFDDAIRLHWFDASLVEAGLVCSIYIRCLPPH